MTILPLVALGRELKLVEKIKSLETENEELKVLAFIDPLTGIYNRRYFANQMEKAFWQGMKQERPISVIFIDIDDLKNLNTTLGYYGADQAIRLIAQTIKETCAKRSKDLVCRYGGDEIVVLLPDTDEYGASYLQACIDRAISTLDYSVSCGSATIVPNLENNWIELVKTASEKMVTTKACKKLAA